MSIGRTFEECFQKAMRMVGDGVDGFGDTASFTQMTDVEVQKELENPSGSAVFFGVESQ